MFGFVIEKTNNLVVVSDRKNHDNFLAWKEIIEKDSSVNSEYMDFFEKLQHKYYSKFPENLLIISFSNEKSLKEFSKEHKIEIMHLYDCYDTFVEVTEERERIKERDENNRIRKEAYEKGEVPKTTIGNMYYSDGYDPFDKRSKEEQQKGREKTLQSQKKIAERYLAGEIKAPLLTNVDKEFRDAKDMSHLSGIYDGDFGYESDYVPSFEEFADIMVYNDKVSRMRDKEEIEKLKKELYTKLSKETIEEMEKREAYIEMHKKENLYKKNKEILESAKKMYKNKEVSKDAEHLDIGEVMSIEDFAHKTGQEDAVKKIYGGIKEVKIFEMPLSAINGNMIIQCAEGTAYDIDRTSIIGNCENLKLIQTIKNNHSQCAIFEIVDKTKDCYVVFCDNRLINDNHLKQEAYAVRYSLSNC